MIVVDDASSPSLEPEFNAFKAESTVNSIFIRNDVNAGRSASRNRGIAAAQGEILIFMDVDQLLDQNFLAALDRSFGCNLKRSIRANTRVWPCLLDKSSFLRFYDARFLGNRTAELTRFAESGLPPKYYATTCVATGSQAVKSIGGFDEAFTRYGCEDEELGARLEKVGVALTLGPDAKSFSTDADLTIRRACLRLVDYARDSLPLLLAKHPDYARHTPLPLLEARSNNPIPREILLLAYRPFIAHKLLGYLEKRDSHPNFNPSRRLYQLLLLGFYLIGVRARRERK